MTRSITAEEPRVLHRDAGFRYLVATEESAGAIVSVLSESFVHEPMSKALGVTAEQMAGLIEVFIEECTTNGLSVIAVPEDEPETLAGVFIGRDFKSPLPDTIIDDYPWFHPIAAALGEVDETYETTKPGLVLGDAVDLWMVGVAPGSRFAGRGIAGTLFKVTSELAGVSGFGRCVTECTGHFSQTAARKAGFEERARLAYDDFRFDGRPVFAEIEAPHTHVVLFEKQF